MDECRDMYRRFLLKFFFQERVVIASGKTRVETKILIQSQRGRKPIFESRSVYTKEPSKFGFQLFYCIKSWFSYWLKINF